MSQNLQRVYEILTTLVIFHIRKVEVSFLTTRTSLAHIQQLKLALSHPPDLSPFKTFTLHRTSKSFCLQKLLKTSKKAFSVNSMAIAAILEK